MTACHADTALAIARIADGFGLNLLDRGETVRRFRLGAQSYGYDAHLRKVGQPCWNCSDPVPEGANFCPRCGHDVTPYDWREECRQELLDALNQVGIAVQRGDMITEDAECQILGRAIVHALNALRNGAGSAPLSLGEHFGDAE